MCWRRGGEKAAPADCLILADPLGRRLREKSYSRSSQMRSAALATDPAYLKRLAAEKALDYVRPGTKVGLGTGSTAALFVDALAVKVRAGLEVLCVPTSEATRRQAEGLGIALTTLDEAPELDLTVDGADELDDELNLIKGGGGALLREKIVAASSKRLIVIADGSKRVKRLGAFPLPVEVVPFGLASTRLRLEACARALGLSGKISLRERDGRVFVTDGGHYILDCAFGAIPDPKRLADALAALPGVVDHGLFIGLASAAVLANANGIEILESKTSFRS
jgi:ribose 5-phosphate isomerase A